MPKVDKIISGNHQNDEKSVSDNKKIFGLSLDWRQSKPLGFLNNKFEKYDVDPDEYLMERVRAYEASGSFFDPESLSDIYLDPQDINAINESFIESNIDYIEKGTITVRVIDKHNFYETEKLTEEDINRSKVGLLTKLWISISRAMDE